MTIAQAIKTQVIKATRLL